MVFGFVSFRAPGVFSDPSGLPVCRKNQQVDNAAWRLPFATFISQSCVPVGYSYQYNTWQAYKGGRYAAKNGALSGYK